MRKLLFFVLLIGLILIITGISIPAEQKTKQDVKLKNLSGHLAVINFGSPNSLSFCGEEVPTQDPIIKERLEKEIKRITHYYASTLLTLKRVNRYKEEFSAIFRAQGIPEDFFYLAIAESYLSNAISPKGAKGFWQFIAPTARHYGLEISNTVDERFHPVKATYAATRYLTDDFSQLKQWTLVAAAFNMGSPRVQRAINRQGVDNYYKLALNKETGNYLYRILALKTVLEQPERYGFNLSPTQLYHPIPFRSIKVKENIPDLVTFAKSHGCTYRELKNMNPWLISNHLEVMTGKTYEIRLPRTSGLNAYELIVQGETKKSPSKTQVDSVPAPDATVVLVTDKNTGAEENERKQN